MDNEDNTLINYIGVRRDEAVWCRTVEPLLYKPEVLAFNRDVLSGIYQQMIGATVWPVDAEAKLRRMMPIYCHRAHFGDHPEHVAFVLAAMDPRVHRYKGHTVVLTFDGPEEGFPVERVRLRFADERGGSVWLGDYVTRDDTKIIPATLEQAESLAGRPFPLKLEAAGKEITGGRESSHTLMEWEYGKNQQGQKSLLPLAGYTTYGSEDAGVRPDGGRRKRAYPKIDAHA